MAVILLSAVEPLASHDSYSRPYRIVGRLGEGGMGVVYAAFYGDTQVALKVIRPEYASDAQFRARFARETYGCWWPSCWLR